MNTITSKQNTEKIIGVITARMASERLPGKVMKDLVGKSVFAHHVERLRNVTLLDGIYLATSHDPGINDPLIQEANDLEVPYYEGEKNDVLERHVKIVETTGATAVIRVTCDMPLFDIPTLDAYIQLFRNTQPDYIYPANFNLLSGTMCELISASAIKKSYCNYKGPAISKYIIENKEEFDIKGVMIRNDICRTDVRLDLDFSEDLELIRQIYDKLYKGQPIPLEEVYKFLDDNPGLILINKFRAHNEAASYTHSLLYNKPIYQIVKAGERVEVLNKLGQFVEYKQFLKEIEILFNSRNLTK